MSPLQKEFEAFFSNPNPLCEFIKNIANDGLAILEVGGKQDFWANANFWSRLNYTEKQAAKEAKSWKELIHPDDRHMEMQAYRSLVYRESGAKYDPVLRLQKRNGAWVWMRLQGVFLEEPNPRVLIAFTEITDLKHKEEFLQHSSEMARIGFYDWDIKGKSLYWSPVTREIHGVEASYQPDYRNAIKFYKEGRSQQKITELVDRALHYGEPYDEELQIVNSDGQECWVRVIGIPELQDGRAIRIYGLFQDIDLKVRTEKAIRSERELYRQVLQGANVGAWDWDVDSDRMTLNRKAAELLGYDLEVMRREGQVYWFDLLHPNDYERVWRELKEYLVGARDEFNTEARLRGAEGNYRWLAINGKLFQPDLHFERPRIVGIWRDIHYEKEKLSYHSTFIQEAPLAIAMMDTKMRYINCSHKWRTDYGLEEQAIIGMSHYEIFPEISQEWKELHQRCLAGEVLRKEEDLFLRADGRKQWIRWEIRPWYDGNGDTGGIIMYTEDITQHKKDQETLARTQRAFEANFKNGAIGMAIIGPDGSWKQVNEKLCSMLGYNEEELNSKTFQDLTHPEDLEKDLALLADLSTGKISHYQMEKRYFRKDGSILKALLAAAVVRNSDGSVEHYISQVIERD